MSKYCVECGKKLADNASSCPECGYKFNSNPINVAIATDKKKGSIGWMIFWLIMFWPAAIVYIFIRDWSK